MEILQYKIYTSGLLASGDLSYYVHVQPEDGEIQFWILYVQRNVFLINY